MIAARLSRLRICWLIFEIRSLAMPVNGEATSEVGIVWESISSVALERYRGFCRATTPAARATPITVARITHQRRRNKIFSSSRGSSASPSGSVCVATIEPFERDADPDHHRVVTRGVEEFARQVIH